MAKLSRVFRFSPKLVPLPFSSPLNELADRRAGEFWMQAKIVREDGVDRFQAVAGDRRDLELVAAGQRQPGDGGVAPILVTGRSASGGPTV